MKIKRFTVGPLEVNCYLLWDEQTHEAAVIDYGARRDDEHERFAQFVEAEKLTLRMALQTHTHFDHVFGLKRLAERYGLSPQCHPDEQKLYRQAATMADMLNLPMEEPLPSLGTFLNDGDEITLGNSTLHVIHTPGHSPGSVCFHLPEAGILFCGDTLFAQGIGRTDLPGGNYGDIERSIKEKLYTLPPETCALPGHGPQTTIGWERENNMFVRG